MPGATQEPPEAPQEPPEAARSASRDEILEGEADRKWSNHSASPNRTRFGHSLNQTVSNCRYDLAGWVFLTSVARGTSPHW